MSSPLSNWQSYGLVFVGTTISSLFGEANDMTSFWMRISDDGNTPCLLVSLDAWRFGQNIKYATVSLHVANFGRGSTYPNQPGISSGRRVAFCSSSNPWAPLSYVPVRKFDNVE